MKVLVKKTDTVEDIAGSIAGTINTIFNCPVPQGRRRVTATAEAQVLDLVSVAKSTDGIQVSFDSEDNGLKIVASDRVESKLTLTTNWKEVFENLGSTRYNYIVCGLSDVDTLKAFSEELESRYSALRQIGGRMFAYLSGVVGDATTENSIIPHRGTDVTKQRK